MSDIQSYKDLKVWQKSMEIARACYEITSAFLKEELFGMTSQIRRAAASIPANIAEGYGRDSRVGTSNSCVLPRAALRNWKLI